MSELVTLSEQLTDEEWLAELAAIGADRGYFEQIGNTHTALFLDETLDTLMVSFDTVTSARTGSASGISHGMLQAEIFGWSHLSLIAKTPTWFRDDEVVDYFDRLVDEAFFEDFDRVIFYGAGMCAYAAAAFSVAAPGATVVLAAPQATLDPAIAPWDDRFLSQRRRDFTSRYGYAPDMVGGAEAVYIFYDPMEELDAMHAALFRGPQVHHLRMRHFGARIGDELQAMNVLGRVFKAASESNLTAAFCQRLLRRRRRHLPYLKNLLSRLHVEERHYLTILLCRSVLQVKDVQRFRHHLRLAEGHLEKAGRPLPVSHRRKRGAESLPRLSEAE
ncbi:MAG: phosphoadenosine phosphosulfate reductase [Pseudomonadota bacterium]